MLHRLEIQLPQQREFYENECEFDVFVDTGTCGTFKLSDGTQFTLAAPILLRPTLAALDPIHRASVAALTEASLRFYRSGGINTFALSEYLATLFLTRYEWGLAFDRSAVDSIEHVAASKAVYHFEAGRRHSEMFAYGLAVHFAATLLGIPVDRLFFISAAGTRPDFRSRVSLAELTAAGASIGGLSATGAIVELEVKALKGWASFRSNGDQGKALLKNLADKASSKPNHVHLCVGVALPASSPTTRTKTRILIADPGDAEPLGERRQAILLLEESLVLLLRHGLWPTLAQALKWLLELRGDWTNNETELYAEVGEYDAMPQYRIVNVSRDDRTFNGRIFNDVVGRLGRIGRRGMLRAEAQERIRTDNLGSTWFSGVDVDWIAIIKTRDIRGLLSYGVSERGGRNLTGRSAYLYSEEPMGDAERSSVREALSQALQIQDW